jgi:hypothetical protein
MLRCAVHAHRTDLAEFLLDQGVNVDSRDAAGRTLLFDAADMLMADALIRHGAAIDATDSEGNTALGVAIARRHAQAAVTLIKAGANAGTGERSAVKLAIAGRQSSVVSVLIARGIDQKEKDADGRGAVFWAAEANDVAGLKTLLAQGADVNVRDRKGWTPLHVAAQQNNRSLVSFLLEQHANPALQDVEGQMPRDRATAEDVRTLLAVQRTAWDQPLATKDAAACMEVAQRAHQGKLGGILVFGEPAAAQHDPNDNWRFLGQVPTRYQVKIAGHIFILGSDRGPVYLSRVDDAGFEGVVCEFASLPGSDPPAYRVLGQGERLPGELAGTRAH